MNFFTSWSAMAIIIKLMKNANNDKRIYDGAM